MVVLVLLKIKFGHAQISVPIIGVPCQKQPVLIPTLGR